MTSRQTCEPAQPRRQWPLFAGQRPALVVVDMQRDYLDPGAPIEVQNARKVIGVIGRLIEAFHRAGLPVVHVITIHRLDRTDWELHERDAGVSHCLEGTPGAEIVPELRPAQEDHLVIKKRYSSFHGTELELLLRGLGVGALVICGVTTECCVRSTAMDAYARDFRLVVPSDATESFSDQTRDVSLRDISACVGPVPAASQIIESIRTW